MLKCAIAAAIAVSLRAAPAVVCACSYSHGALKIGHPWRIPLSGGYTMGHSSAVCLMGARGGFKSVISYKEASAQALGQLRELVRS